LKEDTFIIADGSVIIDGTNLGTGNDCLAFDTDPVSSIIGLEIRNCPRDGIIIEGVMPIVTVQDCYIHDNQSARDLSRRPTRTKYIRTLLHDKEGQ
jgi:hypothetical protein